LTVISSAGVTVEGATSSTDAVRVSADVDISNLNATFDAVSLDGHISMHTGFGTSVLGATTMHDIEYVQFNNATVRIVGAGGYASLSDATAAAHSGDVIYVTDSSLASGLSGVINNANVSIYIANGDTANMTMAPSLVQADGNGGFTGGAVKIYGNHSFSLTGSAGNDTIHDYTNIASSGTNTIHGADGNDSIIAHNNQLGLELIYGDGGNDTLVGGGGSTVRGGDGNDILLALGGASQLYGEAGNDVLLNAYASSDANAKAVTMTGGSGNDTFALIGTNDASATGSMKTIISDLGTW